MIRRHGQFIFPISLAWMLEFWRRTTDYRASLTASGISLPPFIQEDVFAFLFWGCLFVCRAGSLSASQQSRSAAATVQKKTQNKQSKKGTGKDKTTATPQRFDQNTRIQQATREINTPRPCQRRRENRLRTRAAWQRGEWKRSMENAIVMKGVFFFFFPFGVSRVLIFSFLFAALIPLAWRGANWG